jgi:hypothetical protein
MEIKSKPLNRKKIKKFISKIERYANFTFIDKSTKFNDFAKDKDITTVQVHDITPFWVYFRIPVLNIKIPLRRDVCGFAGVFAWHDNTLYSLDGDSYNEKCEIYGYNWFVCKDGSTGLDILVSEDW